MSTQFVEPSTGVYGKANQPGFWKEFHTIFHLCLLSFDITFPNQCGTEFPLYLL